MYVFFSLARSRFIRSTNVENLHRNILLLHVASDSFFTHQNVPYINLLLRAYSSAVIFPNLTQVRDLQKDTEKFICFNNVTWCIGPVYALNNTVIESLCQTITGLF